MERKGALFNIYRAHKVKELVDTINKTNHVDFIHFSNHGSNSLFFDRSIPYTIRTSGFYNILYNGASKIGGSLQYSDNPENDRQKLEVIAMRNAKSVIAPSNLLANIANNELGIKTDVLESPFVFNKDNWNSTVYDTISMDGKKYVLYYGTFRILKGIHIIGQIAKELLGKHQNLKLVLCGRDEQINICGEMMASDYVKEMAGEYADRVVYAGQLTREYLYPVIEGAEMVILPSRIENLSNACIESMAMGKIVVATDGASFEQLIDNGKSGFLCERDNPNSYLQAVEKVLVLTSCEKERMVNTAKARISVLEPDNSYNRFLEYYNKIIKEWDN
ncbi:glycosyltransferase family 4 protein [Butyrivibrio sp. ob235]|uniref:glycosyltransferase family 4 protein n=1 Tax=Butyrivibrio sp. ob235 TaxID=1761780 RepID=UPI000B85FAF9|nr:glycosyltransferase family 4 protein [Butyrivibrio sp. ob235]